MVNSSSVNGVGAATATDVEKGESWVEDSQEGETYQTEEGGDLEKGVRGVRGAASGTTEPNLTEPLLTPEEADHEGLAAASTPLVAMDKLIVSLLVICFVLVEAYFVGHSFRNWIDTDEHLHDDNAMNNTKFDSIPLPIELLVVPSDGGGGGVKESITPAEHFDVISEPSVDSGDATVTQSSEEEVSAMAETSTTTQGTLMDDDFKGYHHPKPYISKDVYDMRKHLSLPTL